MPKTFTDRFLDVIERAGNRLPDAVTLFLWMMLILVVASVAAGLAGASVPHPTTHEPIAIVSLLQPAIISRWLAEMPHTFTGFAPLGTVLLAMVGVGFAEKVGLIGAALSGFVRKMPQRLLTVAIVFAGVMSSLAVDAGYVVLIPLAAVVFANAGRHPIAGLTAAFAGVSAGFSANLFPTPLDAQLAGLTQEAARLIAPGYEVMITSNYFIMVALVPLFTLIGAFVSERIIEPRLGPWQGSVGIGDDADEHALTEEKRRGLRNAGLAFLGISIGLVLMTVPEGAILRDAEGSLRPFLKGMVAILSLTFLICGIVYGITVGAVRSDKDVVRMTTASMADLGYYIILVLAMSQFTTLFSWSNFGPWLAVHGAAWLEAMHITGSPLIVGFILLAGLINLLIGSASAKWALLAPTFVPIFMLLGLSPEFSQSVYRMGDAFTNVITPLMAYFPLVVVFASRHMKGFGIGSLISLMLPYSLAFGIGSTTLTIGWYLLDLPLGPDGTGIHYKAG